MSTALYDLIGLAAGVCFILALKGLSHPKSCLLYTSDAADDIL
jgi:NAD/NADP transhydrogenase beta subunit